MTTKVEELRNLAEAAVSGDIVAQFGVTKMANPQTILAMCDLMQQMRDALQDCKTNAGRPEHVYKITSEALAAFDKFNGGE